MSVVEAITGYQVDRAVILNRTDQGFRRVYDVMDHAETLPQRFGFKNVEGVLVDIDVDKQFALGMYLCRRSLIIDLVREDKMALAISILQSNTNITGRSIR